MKRTFYIAIAALIALTIQAQNNSIDAIANAWATKNITVKEGTVKPDIVTLFKAFNKAWPTDIGNKLCQWADKPDEFKDPNGYRSDMLVVDPANGYVEMFSDAAEGQYTSACLWRRSNGHTLLACRLGQMMNEIVCFYDYDPAKKMLVPETPPTEGFTQTFTDSYVTRILPQKGKDIVIDEYLPNWQKSLRHIYEFDGMRHHYARTEIVGLDLMNKYFVQDSGVDPDFGKYALIDIDQDGEPELWLRWADDSMGAIYALREGRVWMLLTEDTEARPIFYKSAVASASDPTRAVVLQYSQPVGVTDGTQPLGDPVTLNPQWHMMKAQ